MGFTRSSSSTFEGVAAEEEEIEETKACHQHQAAAAAADWSIGSSFLMAAANNNNNKGNPNLNHHHQIQFQLEEDQNHHHQHHQQQQQQQQQISYGLMMHHQQQSPPHQSTIHGNFISTNKENSSASGAYDLGELDQALFMYLEGGGGGQDHHHHHHPSAAAHEQRLLQMNSASSAAAQENNNGIRPPTLNIFPSQPMHVQPSPRTSAGVNGGSKRPSSAEQQQQGVSMELANVSRHDAAVAPPPSSGPHHHEPAKVVKREGNNRKVTTSTSSEHEGPKTPDPKTLRRLAQNREAARKSRLRKKAYVQQLESSRIKLTQLEQELQRARAQGMMLSGGGGILGDHQGLPMGINNITSEAAVFDMEYSRWLEEHHRLMCELQAAVQEHLPENELRLFVDNCLAHYDEMIGLKSMAVKTDVFHLVSGMWKTPAERCFMWMGGFRPSELIKIILNQVEPLTEQQILGICGLQQSTQEAEEALTQGLDALHQSLSDTIASDALSYPSNMANYMGQMAMAMNKLATLEGFVRQADNLRHQTLHRLHQLLTTRQAARCFLAIAEYFHRLRALSSLWLSRPRQD